MEEGVGVVWYTEVDCQRRKTFMNIGSAMNLMSQGKQAWATFKRNHPEFPKFLEYVKNKGVP